MGTLSDEEITKEFHKLLNFALAESKENSISDSMKFAAIRLWEMAEDAATEKFCKSLNERVKQEELIRAEARADEREKAKAEREKDDAVVVDQIQTAFTSGYESANTDAKKERQSGYLDGVEDGFKRAREINKEDIEAARDSFGKVFTDEMVGQAWAWFVENNYRINNIQHLRAFLQSCGFKSEDEIRASERKQIIEHEGWSKNPIIMERIAEARADERRNAKREYFLPTNSEQCSLEMVKCIRENVIPVNVQNALAWALTDGTPTLLWNIAQEEGWVRRAEEAKKYSCLGCGEPVKMGACIACTSVREKKIIAQVKEDTTNRLIEKLKTASCDTRECVAFLEGEKSERAPIQKNDAVIKTGRDVAPENVCPFCGSTNLGHAREFRLGENGAEDYATDCGKCNRIFYLSDYAKPRKLSSKHKWTTLTSKDTGKKFEVCEVCGVIDRQGANEDCWKGYDDWQHQWRELDGTRRT